MPSFLVRPGEGSTEIFKKVESYMVCAAQEAAKGEAVSWRNFDVGSAVLAYNVETRAIGIFTGYNISPFRGARKRCAEVMAVRQAVYSDYLFHQILAIVVVAPPQADDHSKLCFSAGAIPVCLPCCKILSCLSEMILPNTIVLSMDPSLTKSEQLTWKELCDGHESAIASK